MATAILAQSRVVLVVRANHRTLLWRWALALRACSPGGGCALTPSVRYPHVRLPPGRRLCGAHRAALPSVRFRQRVPGRCVPGLGLVSSRQFPGFGSRAVGCRILHGRCFWSAGHAPGVLRHARGWLGPCLGSGSAARRWSGRAARFVRRRPRMRQTRIGTDSGCCGRCI